MVRFGVGIVPLPPGRISGVMERAFCAAIADPAPLARGRITSGVEVPSDDVAMGCLRPGVWGHSWSANW